MENSRPIPGKTLDVAITVNGQAVKQQLEARMTLADFLRYELGLTGTHVGCEQGVCGACTVLVDGVATRSCILYAVQVDGRDVVTVEGLTNSPNLHPLQRLFGVHGALQCGFCTPGFLLCTMDLLRRSRAPNETQIRQALSGNLCRCTGYQPIVDAVVEAVTELHEADKTQGEISAAKDAWRI